MKRLYVYALCVLVVGLWVPGCRRKKATRELSMERSQSVRHSGYNASVIEWRSFLSCWFREWRRKSDDFEWDVQFEIVKRDVLEDGGGRLSGTEEAYRKRIIVRQEALHMPLPASYVDFLLAYQPEESYRVPGDGSHSSARIVNIDSMDVLGSVQPEYAAQVEQAADGITFADDEYFVYGVHQDNVVTRPEYARDSLLVGHYGFDSFEIVALHPQVRSGDGEMEAELYQRDSSVRVPSFAEMMLRYYMSRMHGAHPPFSAKDISSTCASLLPVEGWWSR